MCVSILFKSRTCRRCQCVRLNRSLAMLSPNWTFHIHLIVYGIQLERTKLRAFFFFLYLCRYNMICVDVVVLCYHRRMLSPQSTNCLSITGRMHTITGGICLLIREVAHFRYGNSSDVLTHTYIHYTDNLISKYWILKFVCRWLQTLNVIWAKLLPQRCVMGDHSNTDPSLRI